MPHFYKTTILFLLILGFSLNQGWAQDVVMSSTSSSITTTNGALITLSLKLENKRNTPIATKLSFTYDEEVLRFVNMYPDGFSLAPNETLFVPIKAIVSRNAASLDNAIIGLGLLSLDGQLLSKLDFPLKIKEKKLVRLQLLNQKLTFEKGGDTLTIPVKLSNMGNTPQKINLVTRFFEKSHKKDFELLKFNLEAFRDTLLYICKIVDSKTLKEDELKITIKGLYSDGSIFGNSTLFASAIKESRRFKHRTEGLNPSSMARNNQIRISILKNGDYYQYYLLANNQFNLKKGTLESNLDINYMANNQQYLIRNSRLSYDSEFYGLSAGNIYNSTGLLNLNGRGGSAYYEDPNNRIELGALDKTYNLMDARNASNGRSAWANFTHNGGWLNKGYEVSMLYDTDAFNNSKSYIAATKASILDQENLKLRIGGALSQLQSTGSENDSELGGIGELNFLAKNENLSFSSTNTYSSAYFAGYQRGAFNTSERISYSKENYNLWGSYNLYRYSPKPFGDNYFMSSDFLNQRFDIGVSKSFKNFHLSLTPTLVKEKRNELETAFQNSESYQMTTKDIMFGFSFSDFHSKQNLSLNITGGIFHSNMNPDYQKHLKSSLNYSYKNFRVHAYYQKNQFQIGEIISLSRLGTQKGYELFSIMPSYHHDFWDKKLQLRAGFNYNKTPFGPAQINFNGRADYHFNKNLKLFFNTYYSGFEYNYYQTATMEFGVVKSFSKILMDEKKHQLQVYVYRTLDTGKGLQKVAAEGEMVFIDNKAFRTNDKGIITYKKLPEGTYKVHVSSKKDWYVADARVDLFENKTIAMELTKTSTIMGKVGYKFTALSYKTSKELHGFPIILTDKDGDTHYTRTDNNGNFRLYVPEGSYTIQLDKPAYLDMIEVPDNHQNLEVKSGELQQVKFTLNIKERRVIRKKF